MTDLARSYERCRQISRGSTFAWAARILPRDRRPHVHALYAFARLADDIVDDVVGRPVPLRAAELTRFADGFYADLARGRSDDDVLAAVVHTTRSLGIGVGAFERFLGSMEMDLHVASYETWDDLLVYMDGSAAVIGEMLLPVLEPADVADATPPARDLGLAFQLTNFLRDVGEDLDRGRQYLPQEDLRRFGVDLAERRAGHGVARLVHFEANRCRELYASAETGISMLHGRSRRCVRAAHALYSQLLERIDARGGDVFAGRVRLGRVAKATIVGRELIV